jgi:hypothetical protein
VPNDHVGLAELGTQLMREARTGCVEGGTDLNASLEMHGMAIATRAERSAPSKTR